MRVSGSVIYVDGEDGIAAAYRPDRSLGVPSAAGMAATVCYPVEPPPAPPAQSEWS